MVTGSETLLGTTFTASAVSVFIINLLKNSRWFPFLQKEWKTAQRIWALAVSGVAAVGIDVTFLHGTLTISGLSFVGVLTGLWLWLKSFALQEWIYQSSKQQSFPVANFDAGGSLNEAPQQKH